MLSGYPVAFVLGGVSLLVALMGGLIGVFDLALLQAFPQRIYGIMTNEVLIAIPMFVFMGVMLERSKLADELLENMGRLFGGRAGGLAYSVILVGGLLAASTGIAGASVVTLGLISLPVMLRRGYSPSLSCGIIAATGTLGQIIPPSIVLVVLGDQLAVAYQNAQFEQGIFSPETVSVNELFAGAIVPGLVLVGLYLSYVLIVSIIKPNSVPSFASEGEKNLDGNLRIISAIVSSLIAPLLLIVAVLGSILSGIATATEAAAMGGAGSIMLAAYKASPAARKKILVGALSFALMIIMIFTAEDNNLETGSSMRSVSGLFQLFLFVVFSLAFVQALFILYRSSSTTRGGVLFEVVYATMRISSMVFIILIGATMFSLIFNGLGGHELVEHWLQNIPGGTFAAVFSVMALMFFLGFFLDYMEIVFIVIPIVAPVLLQMEITPGVPMSPVWLGVMMGVNLQTSYLTPPFGFALFFLRGVVPETVKTRDIYTGVIPFVSIQLLCIVVISLFPKLATWLPSMLYD